MQDLIEKETITPLNQDNFLLFPCSFLLLALLPAGKRVLGSFKLHRDDPSFDLLPSLLFSKGIDKFLHCFNFL